MHTARWDHEQDLTGKRVAIIGTGASAVQVIPEIAPIVEHLTVFQRTPIWCFPKPDVPLSPMARRLMRLPGGHAVQRAAQPGLRRAHLHAACAVLHPQSDGQEHVEGRRGVSAQAGPRPGGARQAHAALRRRLQAARLPQHLPVDVQPRQRRVGDRADRQDHRVGRGDRRRRDPRCRRAHPGDRVQGDGRRRQSDLSGDRAGRPVVERALGRAPTAVLRGRQRARLSELLHRVRPVRLRRKFVLRADRDADPPHRALPETGSTQARQPRRGETGGQRPLLRRDDAQAAPADLLAGQLQGRQKLLLRQERRCAAAAGQHARDVLAQPPLPARRLRVQRPSDACATGSTQR